MNLNKAEHWANKSYKISYAIDDAFSGGSANGYSETTLLAMAKDLQAAANALVEAIEK